MNKILLSFVAIATTCIASAQIVPREIQSDTQIAPLMGVSNKTTEQKNVAEEEQWVKIGTGVYTDVVISSISRTKSIALSVEFEQSVSDPNTYRIQYPYANWNHRKTKEMVTYDPQKATPLIFHVVDDKYAWFEEFNSGFYIDTEDDYGPIVGEITVDHAAEYLIQNNDWETVVSVAPSTLCTVEDGTITLAAEYSFPSTDGIATGANVRISVAGEPMWRGNRDGAFCIQLPTAKDLNPNMKWNSLGKAKFTDGFSALFAYQDEPIYPIYEIEIQQNEADSTIYRLVNPYAEWNCNYSSYDFNYDTSNNYYMTIYTFPELKLACTNTFFTGLNTRIKATEGQEGESEFEMFGIQNQAYYFYESYASTFGWYLSEVAEEFPEMFGTFEDGILTYPGYYEDEYSGQVMQFPTFVGWTGSYFEAEENEYMYVINKTGNFRVEFPGVNAPGAVEDVAAPDDNTPVEYFNLQGMRLEHPQRGTFVIERRGTQVVKKIYR